MEFVEILASLVVYGHVFHQKPSFDERAQGSPSSVVVIEERTKDRDAPLAQVTNAPSDISHGVHYKAMATDLFFH